MPSDSRRRRHTTAKGNKKTKSSTQAPPTDNVDSTHDQAEARPEDSESAVVEPLVTADSDEDVPIHRIPPEILKVIFKFSLVRRWRYTDDEDNHGNHYRHSSHKGGTVIPWTYPVANPFHLITISAVCRYWKMVALDMPVLCSNVAPANVGPHGPRTRSDHKKFASTTLTYVKRAGQRPVNLVVDRPGQAMDIETLLSVLDRDILSRLREIHCHYLPKRRPIDTVFDFPAPSLESLHLGHDVCVLDTPECATYAQRKPLFNGVTPRLRYLSLTHLENVVHKLLVPSLTHLHLHRCSLTFPWLASDLASGLLKNLPELTDLSLSMVRFPDKDRPTRPKLPLGKLRRLTLSGIQGSNDIGNLINYVAIPSDASILFRDCKPLSPELVDGSQGLQSYFTRRPWTRLSISSQPVSGRPVSHVCVIGTDDQVGVAFDWAREHSGSELGYRLRFPIPLPGVHECWIMEPTDTPAALSVSELHVMFHSMAGLRTLVVCPWNARTVLDALELPPDKSASNMDIFRVCPILTELRVIARNPHSIPADTLNALDVLGRSRTLERVVVCYLHPGAEAQDPGRGGGVEYVHLKEPAEMELPPVCKTEEHAFWPKWRSHADTVFG